MLNKIIKTFQIHLVLDSINTLVYTLLTGILVMTKQFKDYLLEVQDGATDPDKVPRLMDPIRNDSNK